MEHLSAESAKQCRSQPAGSTRGPAGCAGSLLHFTERECLSCRAQRHSDRVDARRVGVHAGSNQPAHRLLAIITIVAALLCTCTQGAAANVRTTTQKLSRMSIDTAPCPIVFAELQQSLRKLCDEDHKGTKGKTPSLHLKLASVAPPKIPLECSGQVRTELRSSAQADPHFSAFQLDTPAGFLDVSDVSEEEQDCALSRGAGNVLLGAPNH